MRGPVESEQYLGEDYTQVLDDHRVLQSVGSVGDCYDNALSESFVDSYKTELIADRVWRTNAQLGLATVDYVGWFNHRRLHSSLGFLPPVEYELRWELSQLEAWQFEPLPARTTTAAVAGRPLPLVSPLSSSENLH